MPWLARAVLDAVARVDDDVAGIFALLQQGYRALFAAHVEDDVLFGLAVDELLFAVDVHFASASMP